MADKIEISTELKQLGSDLPADILPVPYRVPAGYFDSLAANILSRVRALEALSPSDELAALSPLLTSISKQNPYALPAGYFDSLNEQVDRITKGDADFAMDAAEELETLSPLLKGLKGKNTYSVPAGYFDNLSSAVLPREEKETARVVPLFRRNWVRYAAAAVVLAFIATFALVNRSTPDNNIDPNSKSFAWVEKNLDKVSTDEIAKFVDQLNGDNGEIASTETTVEVNNLLKDVSDKEIADFLKDTQVADTNADDDILLN